tara:strand:- start:981 stop:1670 length:690 start_codon:yes stop_codon:yes gene_type:complete
MTVPSSGNELSLTSIYSEKNEGDYTANNPDGATDISLRGLSDNDEDDSSVVSSGDEDINVGNLPANRPDTFAPHAMSEFYSYDHNATAPAFLDTLSDFTLTATAGIGAAAVFSDTYMIRLTNALGNVYASITNAAAFGTLSVAVGTSDPTVLGTGGGAGGFTAATGITGGLAVSGSQRIFIKFKFQPAGPGTGSTNCNVRFSINPSSASAQGLLTGIVDNATVTAKAVS